MTGDGLRRSHGWIAALLLVAGIALYVPLQVMGPLRGLHSNDFKHIYLGMQALLEREEPYSVESLVRQAHRQGMAGASLNPYVYLPFTGLAMGFLSPLRFPAAAVTWFALNHLFLLGSIALFSRALFRDWSDRRQWAGHAAGLLLIACALNHPWTRTLTAGQLNGVLLLCLAGAFAALRAGRDGLAGSVLGFAALFKLSPGLFLVTFLIRRRWRALGFMIATMALLGLASVAAVGVRIHLDFLPMLKQMSYGHSTWQDHGATFWKDPANQSLNSLLTHLLVSGNMITDPWIESDQHTADTATRVATAAAALLFLAVFARVRRGAAGRADEDAAFMATILLALLIPSLMWDHYLVLAIMPAAWLAWELGKSGRRARAFLAAAAFVLTAIPWQYDAPRFLFGAQIPLMTMKWFPTVLLYALCLAAKGLLSGREDMTSEPGSGTGERVQDPEPDLKGFSA